MEARPWSLRLLPVGWSVQPVVFHPVTDAGGGGNGDFTGVHRRVLMTRWGGRNSVTRFLPTVGSLEKTTVLTVFSILTLVFSILTLVFPVLTFVKWGFLCCLKVPLRKCRRAVLILKTPFLICRGARLSLSFHKIGCGSAMSSLKTLFSICHGARLSLSLQPQKDGGPGDGFSGRKHHLPQQSVFIF